LTDELPETGDQRYVDFADWVRPWLPAMLRLAARLMSPDQAEDVVQESLVRAWRKRKLFDPTRGTTGGWLLAIVADNARHARSHLLRDAPTTDLADASTTGARTPDTAADIDLERALNRLSSRQRLAVDCVYFVGLTVAETAAVMGCREGTVKSTLADARRKLRALLDGAS
jgi:RNA polymerase sigma factor (sigma-70 family)